MPLCLGGPGIHLAACLQRMRNEGLLRTEGDSKTPREISRDYITLLEQLGEGHFGGVFKAILNDIEVTGMPEYLVAVKVCPALQFLST